MSRFHLFTLPFFGLGLERSTGNFGCTVKAQIDLEASGVMLAERPASRLHRHDWGDKSAMLGCFVFDGALSPLRSTSH